MTHLISPLHPPRACKTPKGGKPRPRPPLAARF